jgi:hypothetical protein
MNHKSRIIPLASACLFVCAVATLPALMMPHATAYFHAGISAYVVEGLLVKPTPTPEPTPSPAVSPTVAPSSTPSPTPEPANFDLEGKLKGLQELNLIKGQSIRLTGLSSGVTIISVPEDETTLNLENNPDGTVTFQARKPTESPFKIKAKRGSISVPLNGKDEITVTIADFLVSPNATILTGAPATPLSKVVTSPSSDFEPTVPLKFRATDPNFLTYNEESREFIGITATQEAEIEVKTSIGDIPFAPSTFRVKVTKRAGALSINGNGTNTLFVGGGRSILYAQVTNSDGTLASPQPAVTWDIETANDRQYVALTDQNTNTVQVAALKAPSDANHLVRIRARIAPLPDGTIIEPSTYPLFIRGERNVVGFKPISVRIDMLDDRTSKDLFGRVASNDYHVAKVRIVNDLTAPEGGGPASSIIFFSDALEVRVALEKKSKKKRNNESGWVPIDEYDIYRINNWKPCSPTQISSQKRMDTNVGFQACDLILTREINACKTEFLNVVGINEQNAKIAACEADVKLEHMACTREVEFRVAKGSCRPDDFDCINRFNFCEIGLDPRLPQINGQVIPFRPYVYQIVANTHDRRDDRSIRSMMFLGANLAASGTSFFTSFLTLGPGNDLPLALDKYQNLLLPTLGKLFPSMREVQRQNIISEVLPPLVDLPYGSDVSKYVFFPKRKIEGILPEHDVRISSISSYNIQARVGIVQKTAITQTP